MNLDSVQFHHLGLAVAEPTKAVSLLTSLGYTLGDRVFDPGQGVHLIWCSHLTMPHVEVIYQTQAGGPLDSILIGRNESIYHICFAAEDVKTTLAEWKGLGLRVICVSAQKPSVLFANQAVSFYYV